MDDETPTNHEDERAYLQKQIDYLEGELSSMQEKLNKFLGIEQACRDMAQKLATIHNQPLADWWWPR